MVDVWSISKCSIRSHGMSSWKRTVAVDWRSTMGSPPKRRLDLQDLFSASSRWDRSILFSSWSASTIWACSHTIISLSSMRVPKSAVHWPSSIISRERQSVMCFDLECKAFWSKDSICFKKLCCVRPDRGKSGLLLTWEAVSSFSVAFRMGSCCCAEAGEC